MTWGLGNTLTLFFRFFVTCVRRPRFSHSRFLPMVLLPARALVAQATNLYSQLRGRYSRATLLSLAQYDENEVPLEVIIDLVQHIDCYMEEGAILIFLSGWEEISWVSEAVGQ